jgi:hypothetical protein
VPEELFDRIVREIRERKERSRAAFEESRRLKAALTALNEAAGDGDGASASRPAARRRTAQRAQSRAPRGANVRRIRAEIEQRPGARAGEVAAVTGIARPTVASTLGKLARDGELEKLALPGGGVGYRRTRESEPVAARPGRAARDDPRAAGAGGQT